MKFTDGFWHPRRGVTLHYAREVDRVHDAGDHLHAVAPTRIVTTRGDVLNQPTVTVDVDAPMTDVVRVRLTHHKGRPEPRRFELASGDADASVTVDGGAGVVRSGALEARLEVGKAWDLTFSVDGRVLTRSGSKSAAWVHAPQGALVDRGPVQLHDEPATSYMLTQLDLGVGELVYGLGERFGPYVKNGQSVDIWNYDGGTSSEQAYKNVPFYLTNRGYGVFVDDPGYVSFEVGSEAVERVQFSVEGETLQYYVIHGPDPATILERYTALTGRAPQVPAWTYGLWLSTSFTTDYDEETVNAFVDGMAARRIPLSVFHFDCFWMREFNWCDFDWDPRTFPDPEGQLARLHERGLRVCVWINPYIAQESPLFAEGLAAGYLVRNRDGSVWQWDRWQAGMGLVDFTHPGAFAWFKDHLRRVLRQGVDCIKTDFGERIPTDVVYHDGSDPRRMHNLYTHLYNRAVHEVLVEERGQGEATLFARSATAGGQQYPVHWGGDSTSSFASMAETLRGGLSLALSGFGFWSHDIGGFEGTPDPAVFKRWVAFGLLSSHSRLHASESYRVPWAFGEADDDPQGAVAVTRRFSQLKNRLVPYLLSAAREVSDRGTPVLRPMVLEFPQDPAVGHLDRQYLLGRDLLVAPVFSAEGDVDLYLPAGSWTSLLTGATVTGGRWVHERHAFDSVPVYVRPGGVVPVHEDGSTPEHASLDGLTLVVNPGDGAVWPRTVDVPRADGSTASFTVREEDGALVVDGPADVAWGVGLPAGTRVAAVAGTARLV